MSESVHDFCPKCMVGSLQPVLTGFTGVLHGSFVSVPAMPALQCDVCGLIEYSPVALSQLEALFGQQRPSAGPPRAASARPPGDADSVDWPHGPRFTP